ncbi:MAG: NAD(P)/FAD-dependent oxidoreductase [Ferruginibacter sp.]
MNPGNKIYDVAIAGGGLAGLCLSIQLVRHGHSVILFEKETYPFHKVCGEYISIESWDFLEGLGVNLTKLNVSKITELQVSAVNGKMFKQSLPLGGFGISRYLLDHHLAGIAVSAGVTVMENCRINDIVFNDQEFAIDTGAGLYKATVACGSFGKRSNLDIKWKRPFAQAAKNKLNNYIGIKYHIHTDFPTDTIALHNFKNGYCGMVKIEDDKYNLCYLTTADNLKKSNGSIQTMEQTILSSNPHLKKIFEGCKILYEEPLSISQISFDKKNQVENHVLMTGDAAGMITPLCGNGMSMAMHGSKLAAGQIDSFLKGIITRSLMEINYQKQWQQQFSKRLKTGRRIQSLFGNNFTTNLLISSAKIFPAFTEYLIRQTHGDHF